VESILFVLTGNRYYVLALFSTTLMWWLALSNFFLAPFGWGNPNWESKAFLWAVGATVLLAACWSRFQVWRGMRAIRPMSPLPDGDKRPIEFEPLTGAEPAAIVRVLIGRVL